MTVVETVCARVEHAHATQAGQVSHVSQKHHKQIVQNARAKAPIRRAREISASMCQVLNQQVQEVLQPLDQQEGLQ